MQTEIDAELLSQERRSTTALVENLEPALAEMQNKHGLIAKSRPVFDGPINAFVEILSRDHLLFEFDDEMEREIIKLINDNYAKEKGASDK